MQEALLPQADRATRCVGQNLLNYRNKLYNKSTTNRRNGLRGLQMTRARTRRLSYRCRQQARPSSSTMTSFVDNAVDLPWRNFLSPNFGTKFQREVPEFLRYSYFPIKQSEMEASMPKPARFVQSFRYNTCL